MKNIFFYPRVGKNYQETGFRGKKVLILGESHYCGGCNDCGNLENEEDECRNLTSNALQSFFNYKEGNYEHKGWMNTYTKFSNIIHDKSLNYDELMEFWDSVIFYNYVQFDTEKARVSPKDEEFLKSSTAFYEVLEHYQPDIIIVWGERLWNKLPSTGWLGDDIMYQNESRGPLYNYKISTGKIISAYGVYHPSSSAFDYSWYNFLNEVFLKVG